MKTLLLISLLVFSSSCASASWKADQVPFADQGWRICTKEIDGEEFHLEGLCYWQRENKKRFLLPDLTRRVHKFCPFDDKECLIKFPLSGKVIK